MKQIKIYNFGPIKSADVELKQLNVIIGPQSTGKSCLLKVASYCSWIEKKIAVSQDDEFLTGEKGFMERLIAYYRLTGYAKENTVIEYASDYMTFRYVHSERKFTYHWTEKKWEYVRSKISYIPAERIVVGVVPNWYEVNFGGTNLQGFLSDWEEARKSVTNNQKILNLGVSYAYDEKTKKDKISIGQEKTLSMKEASSGLQSLIPLFIHLTYITNPSRKVEEIEGVNRRIELNRLLEKIILEKMPNYLANEKIVVDNLVDDDRRYRPTQEQLKQIGEIYSRYAVNHHCDIFMEEPEENLFPVTQDDLIKWMLLNLIDNKQHTLFIATHSPYVLTSILEEKYDFNLFLIDETPEGNNILTATESDKQRIFDNGIDAFFNLSTILPAENEENR